ncbi:hemolysin [Nibribacter ruber]|uniref:Hemolysin n=1 Tax=Nibribacter ruber TaxID=2698458 RepID=A0A6P1P1Z7_9BACT|nr:hemolysin family protein [Nibribacter ruber]QHL88192.1 hemolysin [Nibribacter ruber]
MDPDIPYTFLSLGAVLLLFLSTAEVALRHLGSVVAQLEAAEQKSLTGFLLRRQSLTFLTIQVGLGLGLLLFGAGLYQTLYQVLLTKTALMHSLVVVLAAGIAVLAAWLLLLGVGMAASLAANGKMLRVLSAPLAFLLVVFYPITATVNAVFSLFSGNEPQNEEELLSNALAFEPFATKLPTAEESTLALLAAEEVDTKIFHNALEFKNVKVRECMVPRTEIDAIELEDGVESLRQAFIETGHSKILIYQDSLDHILGYCHQFSLFKQPSRLEDILMPMEAVPENMLARELFVKFITDHRSIVLVVDEFGGTSGIVTLEDVMEEIFGDINDEYDEEDLLEQTLPEPNTYLFSARQEIDYLNEEYELNLPVGDYETLGGFILSVLEEIPSAGDVITVPPFEIRILSMNEHRINTVHLSVKNPSPEE